jgi:hypothetical protein
LDLLFANGGNYSDPGKPEPNQAFVNRGPGKPFENRSAQVFGPTGDLARVIKARDLNGDGLTDILVGTTFQTQSRLYVGTGAGAFREVTSTNLPQAPASVGDLEFGDVDGDGDLDVVLADWGPGNNMSNEGGRTRLWLNDGSAAFTDVTTSRCRDPRPLFLGPRVRGRRQRRGPRRARLVQALPGRLPVPERRHGQVHGCPGGMPQYTNNYEYEPMDLDGDGFLDLVTINDGRF